MPAVGPASTPTEKETAMSTDTPARPPLTVLSEEERLFRATHAYQMATDWHKKHPDL